MAKIVNPTNGAVGAPLLIKDTHLFALDRIFAEILSVEPLRTWRLITQLSGGI